MERAQAVAHYIDAQTDIPHNKIIDRGKGESHAEGDSAEDREMDRLVIINVTGTLVDQEQDDSFVLIPSPQPSPEGERVFICWSESVDGWRFFLP